jgi:hypothetical protein
MVCKCCLLLALVAVVAASAEDWKAKYEKAQQEIEVLKQSLEESKGQIHVRVTI